MTDAEPTSTTASRTTATALPDRVIRMPERHWEGDRLVTVGGRLIRCSVDESGGMEELTAAEALLAAAYGPGEWVVLDSSGQESDHA